jgi:hypothetical protein
VNDRGRSYVVSDTVLNLSRAGGEVWSSTPATTPPWIDQRDPSQLPPFNPPDGGSAAVLFTIAPADDTPLDMDGVDADGFHATDTVDYVVVLDGSLVLLLDDDDVKLEAPVTS